MATYRWNEQAGSFVDSRGRFVLNDVAPCFMSVYSADDGVGYMESPAERSLAHSISEQAPNEAHAVVCQFGRAIGPTKALSSLGNHVVHVVLVSAEKQMIRAHAGRIVTVVEHPETVRNRSDVQLIREVGHLDAAVIAPAETHMAMALLPVRAHPQPACFGLDDLRPEANLDGRPERKATATLTAKSKARPSYESRAVSAPLVTLPTHRTDLRCQPPAVDAARGHSRVSILPYLPGENDVLVG